MKLRDKDFQKPTAGLPASYREWWDLGDGYEAYITIGSKVCSFWINDANKKDITYKIAKHLNLDVREEHLVKRYKGSDNLYTSMSINTLTINYTKPENYKEILKKIEVIVNEHFKNK